jgi:hypothetical protein
VSSFLFFAPNDLIFNKSYKHWIVKWWRQDDTDNDNVYSLLGTFEDTPIINQTVKINKNKALLLSPINYIAFGHNEQKMRDKVKEEIDIIEPAKVSVVIDGQELGAHCSRISTDFFELEGTKAIADGYWLFLKPLPQGEHFMTTYGTCRSGQIQISNQQNLVIV